MIYKEGNIELFETPVLFLMYNRPDFALQVFKQIRKIKPSKLYIAIDGPKNEIDNVYVKASREIEDLIDWPCEVYKLYRQKNLGCKLAVSSAIDWFFYYEEKGIILEDDCLPDISFFSYCDELLKYYENDLSVGHIAGANFLDKNDTDESYYFSNYSYSWGWATWRRAWKLYDGNLRELPSFLQNKKELNLKLSFVEKAYWNERFIKTFLSKIDTWDYQWLFSLWINNLKSIVPTKNLISNIGFDNRATHTFRQIENISYKTTHPINFIIHPKVFKINNKKDTLAFNNVFRHSLLKSIYLTSKKLLFVKIIKLKLFSSNKSVLEKYNWAFRIF